MWIEEDASWCARCVRSGWVGHSRERVEAIAKGFKPLPAAHGQHITAQRSTAQRHHPRGAAVPLEGASSPVAW